MFEIPDDIVKYFFEHLNNRSKYDININQNSAVIVPRLEQQYYKPNIIVKDLDNLKFTLTNYINTLNEFDNKHGRTMSPYEDLAYILNILMFNMTSTDALDLSSYINKQINFLLDDTFKEYDIKSKILDLNGVSFWAERTLENHGLETPFFMKFSLKLDDFVYELPLIRYSFDNDICHIFSVQMGRERVFNYQDIEYKKIINKVNQEVSKYRNIPPNFVLSLALFLKLLQDNNTSNIMVPDYLFSRYRKYYRNNGENKSDAMLYRILNRYLLLFNRISEQVDGFNITSYPNEVDSFMHIKLNKLSSNNKILKNIYQEK